MGLIQFKEANCKSCYKCNRTCPVKAIKFMNEQARVMDEECILCGNCTIVCPQNAKYIRRDLSIVKGYLKKGRKVYVSLAPSYSSAFGNVPFTKVSAAFKALGFAGVEETAAGAAKVSADYAGILKKGEMKNVITTCCPTVVLLTEKFYPDLIKYLAPTVSPAIAHAKMMRAFYGSDIKVVFIGPCISKNYEAKKNGVIDATLMFDEVYKWLEKENITIADDDAEVSEVQSTLSRLYPIPGGIIRTIIPDDRKKYDCVAVDGIDRCIDALDALRNNEDIKGQFIEMSACFGSCVEGPGLTSFKSPFLITRNIIQKYATIMPPDNKPTSESVTVDLSEKFIDRSIKKEMPSESQINEILAKIGKTKPELMFNCGACGYSNCRDKAIAVAEGKAELHMCIPYMRERAESMANVIFENTPNSIFMLDKDLNMVELNSTAQIMFDVKKSDCIGMPISMVLGNTIDGHLKNMKESTEYFRENIESPELTIDVTATRIEEHNSYLLLIKDSTNDEKHIQELIKIRAETIETAQEVIDKQMRVAQEIASLLGETTGETKAVLTKLKKSMLEGDTR